jgi:S1-C subfamily serine protease
LLPVEPNGTHGTDDKNQPITLVCSSGPVAAPPRESKKKKSRTPAEVAESTAETPTAMATPAPPISPSDQQIAAALVQAYHDSLVFVTGADAAGSGFIASISNGNFLVTNAHVAAGIRDAQFKSLDGTAVRGGTPSIAVGEDIFCMSLPAGGKPLPVMQNVDQNAAIGDSVVVLGNAEGSGVVNTIIGKIVGIGPNLVEVDAPFVPGNSGSPIIHLKTGKVIGVATYSSTQEYDLTTDKKLPQPVVRRFGYRIDSIKGWQEVQWPAFNAQAIQMESIEKLTDDLADFFQDLAENKGVVTMGRHTNPVISTRIDDWIAAKSHNPSAEDIAEADANFLSFLKIACQTDVTAAQSRISYDYFRRELADQKQARDEMAKGFDEIIKETGQ